MRKLITFLIIFCILIIFIHTKETLKIKVKTELANIRENPTTSSKVIKTAKKGDIFIVIEKQNKWYKIALAVDKKGDKEFGFVHSSIVEVIESKKAKKIDKQEKKKLKKESKAKVEKTEKIKKVKKKKTIKKIKQEKLFSGFYLKGGLMTSPKTDSFSDKWLLSLGFDSPIGKYFTWGIEFQPYYRSISDETYQISVNSINSYIFANFKAGVNLGMIQESLKIFTFFTGFGLGTHLSYDIMEIEDTNDTQFNTYFSWHLIFGTEINLKKINVILEFQTNKVINPDLEPSTSSYWFMFFGIRF